MFCFFGVSQPSLPTTLTTCSSRIDSLDSDSLGPCVLAFSAPGATAVTPEMSYNAEGAKELAALFQGVEKLLTE